MEANTQTCENEYSPEDKKKPFLNEKSIRAEMEELNELWGTLPEAHTQTSFINKYVSTYITDFTETFTNNKLDNIFTSEKLYTGNSKGDYNCNMLYRSSFKDPDIPILDTGDFLVLHPLGIPGRDLGKSDNTITHLMVVSIGGRSDNPMCLNEMLPSSSEELDDLKKRIDVINAAYINMMNNEPICNCGPKVLSKASQLGISPNRGVRDFMGDVILSLSSEFKSGTPGYQLNNKEGEYSGNEEKVRLYLNLYNNKQVKCFIQPPCNNTQTFSHIHGFILDTIPDDVANAYRDINMVVKIKEDLITTPTESVLSRTMTNA